MSFPKPNPQSSMHEKALSYNYDYKSFDEETLNKIADRVGKDYDTYVGRELRKFWIQFIEPEQLPVEIFEQNITIATLSYFLPLYLYNVINPYIKNFEQYVSEAQNKMGQIYAPEWYFDLLEEQQSLQLTNNFILYVLNFYNDKVKDEVSRSYWQKRFPWIMNERRKHFYMQKKLMNRLFEIRNEGFKDQSDMLFMYFYQHYKISQYFDVELFMEGVKKGNSNNTTKSSLFLGFNPDNSRDNLSENIRGETTLYAYSNFGKNNLRSPWGIETNEIDAKSAARKGIYYAFQNLARNNPPPFNPGGGFSSFPNASSSSSSFSSSSSSSSSDPSSTPSSSSSSSSSSGNSSTAGA